jgi:hypothetical protein
MYRLPNSNGAKRLATSIGLALLGLATLWLAFRGFSPQLARDFEECTEQVQQQIQAKAPSNDEGAASMMDCNARFAGRRKVDGGYSYYDFMQERNFDIAGPNPTAEEGAHIDDEYMSFLDAQRREAASATLATRQNELLREDQQRARQPIGPPLVLTPANSTPLPVKRPIDRSKSARCEDGPLSCNWAKFSAAVKNAFASSSKTTQP